MSTILQAQQKNKLEQAGGPPPIIRQTNKVQPWKVLLGLALVTIITLLSILIYLLVNPTQVIVPAPIIVKEMQQQAEPEKDNSLVKVSFETQPLSILTPAPQPEPIKQKHSTPKNIEIKQQAVSQLSTKQQETNIQSEVAYQESSEELKKRFDLAVLLSEIDDNELQSDEINEDNSDGSDIRQMNRGFQNKVPIIRYDSHMYSTIVSDRWIRINGETLKEGDFDSSGELELIEIQPQRSIFRLERQSFSLESLVDWKGY